MRFDYYAATVPAQLTHCFHSIEKVYGSGFESINPIRPYMQGKKHVRSGIRVYSGGVNPLPHMVASGADAVLASEMLREVYPTHRVSRVDVASDFEEVEGFDRVCGLLKPLARTAGVAVQVAGDPDPGEGGRTMYFGSKVSDVRLCIYEKGLEQIGRGSKTASPDWFRVELRVRPRKERKAAAASLSASQLWGMSKWTTKAADTVLNICPEYIPDQSLRTSTASQSVAAMFRQYGRSMRLYAAEIGEEAFFEAVKEVLQDG